MTGELPTDIFAVLDEIVYDPVWLAENSSRLAGWEILMAFTEARGFDPIPNAELCDRIGMSPFTVGQIISDLRQKEDERIRSLQ